MATTKAKPVYAYVIYGGALKAGYTYVAASEEHPEVSFFDGIKSYFGDVKGRYGKTYKYSLQEIQEGISNSLSDSKYYEHSEYIYKKNMEDVVKTLKSVLDTDTFSPLGDTGRKEKKTEDGEVKSTRGRKKKTTEDDATVDDTTETTAKKTTTKTTKKTVDDGSDAESTQKTTTKKTTTKTKKVVDDDSDAEKPPAKTTTKTSTAKKVVVDDDDDDAKTSTSKTKKGSTSIRDELNSSKKKPTQITIDSDDGSDEEDDN